MHAFLRYALAKFSSRTQWYQSTACPTFFPGSEYLLLVVVKTRWFNGCRWVARTWLACDRLMRWCEREIRVCERDSDSETRKIRFRLQRRYFRKRKSDRAEPNGILKYRLDRSIDLWSSLAKLSGLKFVIFLIGFHGGFSWYYREWGIFGGYNRFKICNGETMVVFCCLRNWY